MRLGWEIWKSETEAAIQLIVAGTLLRGIEAAVIPSLLQPVTWQESCLGRTIEMMQLLVNVQHVEKKQRGNKKDENPAKGSEERARAPDRLFKSI